MSTTDIERFLLPYWELEGWTDLNYEQIGQLLQANVITGFSFFSPQLYYGTFTPQGFSVRRTYGRFKKQSLSPTVSGQYGLRADGAMAVTLRVAPHPVLRGLFAFFVVGGILIWLPGLLVEVFRTWDFNLLAGGLFPLAAIYLPGWFIFRLVCNADLRFWQNLLRVREVS